MRDNVPNFSMSCGRTSFFRSVGHRASVLPWALAGAASSPSPPRPLHLAAYGTVASRVGATEARGEGAIEGQNLVQASPGKSQANSFAVFNVLEVSRAAQTLPGGRGSHKGVGTRRDGSLGATLENVYHKEREKTPKLA